MDVPACSCCCVRALHAAYNRGCVCLRVIDRMEVHVTYVLPARPQENEIFKGPAARAFVLAFVHICSHAFVLSLSIFARTLIIRIRTYAFAHAYHTYCDKYVCA